MTTKYEALSHEINAKCFSTSVSSYPEKKQRPWCPLLTRARLFTVLAITLLATTVLLFKCVQPGLLSRDFLCCNKVAASEAGSIRKVMYIDEDYEYVDALEGAQNIRYKHTKRRLPNALIIGVRKGGTRAMLEFLNLHPGVQAEKREMHFFDDDDNYGKGLDWYRKKMPFSFPDQVTLEKTPAYFVEEAVPERVYKMNSTIKLLIVIRDPVERAISDYTQVQSTRTEKGKPYDSFRDLAIDGDTGEVNKSYKAIRRSIYHRHMERWLKWFPLSQFHFISGENLVRNPTEELEKVEQFLGLEHKLTKEHFYYNETRGFYCMHLKQKEKCLAKSKGRQHPFVDDETIRKLRIFFKPHNEKFYELVGQDFAWK